MQAQAPVKDLLVWSTVSMAWTEVGLSRDEYPAIANQLRSSYSSWDEVNEIILGDVLGSFALESLLLPFAMIPVVGLLFLTPFPDWGYEETYLRSRAARWHESPRWRHFLNPLRLLGYPIAYLLSLSVRHRLKKAFLQTQT